MGDILLKATSARPGASEITLIDGAVATGYFLEEEADWGNVAWDSFSSGQRGTQGARTAGGSPQNRLLTIPLQVRGASQDDLESKLGVVFRLSEDLRRFGGKVVWRPKGGTYRVVFDVLDAGARIKGFGRLFHWHNNVTVELGLVCAPYAQGDPFDIFDDFTTDSSADYTVDTGPGVLQVSGGAVQPVPAGPLGLTRWRHTARGYQYGDLEATLKFLTPPAGPGFASWKAGIMFAADTTGADTLLLAELNATSLTIATRVAGVETALSPIGYVPTASTWYWMRVRRQGRRLALDLFAAEPTPFATPLASANFTLNNVQHAQFPRGHVGLRINAVDFAERYDDFRVEPFTYRLANLPDEIVPNGAIPGDAPALASIAVTASGGAAAPIWALAAWWQRARVWNRCWNGDFEDDVDGWSVAAVSGVTGAATSIAHATGASAKYGTAFGQIVHPATANTGATFKIPRRFYQGKTYVLLVWASSATPSPPTARCRLGRSGDIASSLATALTPTAQLYTAIWRPTSDYDTAYVAFEITQATATTSRIDGVVVCEGRFLGLAASMTTTQATATLSIAPDDWPTAPFPAILDPGTGSQEIVRVNSVTGAGLGVDRAQEDTVGVTHAIGGGVVPLPELRYQLEGKGAQPAVGIVEAEADDTGDRFTWALTTDATCRQGECLYLSGLNAGGAAASDWLVDPHLLVPEDYTQGELAIEVWARVILHSGLTTPSAIAWAAPENAVFSGGNFTSNYGAVRYTEEFGSIGRNLTKPALGEAKRLVRMGTIRFPIDGLNPLRWRLALKLAWAGAAAATIGLDYLILVPANMRALSPTYKANDANFPKFIPSTSETLKRIRSDLSGLMGKPPGAPQPDHGLGGSLIEVPYGNADFLLKLSSLVADDPTSDATSEQLVHDALLHLALTPRYLLGRPGS